MVSSITICFYTIIYRNKKTIHLTFDRLKHQRALNYAERIFPLSHLEAEFRELPEKDLKDLLSGNRNFFPPIGYKPFVDRATSFQFRVWQLISKIPYGETRTYGELASELGGPNFSRAVGRSCNANPLALFIPCHRVIAQNGLGGFAGGDEIKKRLLELESRIS